MFAKTNILLFSGWIGAGKTTIALAVLDELQKNKVETQYEPIAKSLKYIAQCIGWNGKKDDRGRKLLIDLGMMGREYDSDAWVKQAEAEIEPETEVVIVDDWRFPNEYDYFKSRNKYDITKIRIERAGLLPLNSVSELSLPRASEALSSAYYDIIIHNEPDLLDSDEIYAKQIVSYLYENSKQWS